MARVDFCVNQHVFLCDQFALFNLHLMHESNKISFSYFHGRPEDNEGEFVPFYNIIKSNAQRFFRVQVTHEEIRNTCLDAGFHDRQIRKIPIGINQTIFSPTTSSNHLAMRAKLGIPESATVIGSFQKDGVGWGDGFEPKLIKGPDYFVKVIEKLNQKIKNLYVLLTGPSRGYVIRELKKIGVPYVHHYLNDVNGLPDYYHALDLYIVSSRVEGGPKAILESMATGIPIVSTRVGQAQELIAHGENGFLADVGDVDALVSLSLEALKQDSHSEKRKEAGFATARANSYAAQVPLWKSFFED